jgi:hypothetical protein
MNAFIIIFFFSFLVNFKHCICAVVVIVVFKVFLFSTSYHYWAKFISILESSIKNFFFFIYLFLCHLIRLNQEPKTVSLSNTQTSSVIVAAFVLALRVVVVEVLISWRTLYTN